MRLLRNLFAALALVGLLTAPLLAEPQNTKQMKAEVDALLATYAKMGKKNFETTYPDGKVKEKYTVAADGTVSYAKFFPAGNFAVKYQRKVDGSISYEKWYGNGQAAVILTRDPRITAYVGYWPSAVTKEKFQWNAQAKDGFYLRYDEQGKQVVPAP